MIRTPVTTLSVAGAIAVSGCVTAPAGSQNLTTTATATQPATVSSRGTFLHPEQFKTGDAMPAQMTERQSIALEDSWRFYFGDADLASVTAADFDDSGWEQVSVPHTWNVIGEYALERSGTTNNAQGTGWYRLRLDAPPADRDMRQYLDFAAIGNIADVWVNGAHVGTHRGAFSRFRLDVTGAWVPGGENLVVVRADNSKPAIGSSTENVIPLAGDFFIHGGIYRPAELLQLPSASIDPLDYGGPGVYIRASDITDETATIQATTRLRNAGEARDLSIVTAIYDAEGRLVGQQERPLALSTGTQEVLETITLTNPRLWDGVDDPYLYSAQVSLLAGGEVIDRVVEPFGIRTFRFDADNGFFLNGKHVKLKGVSRHQDRLGQGWALSREDHGQDTDIIAEMGANSVRQAHYQHADEWSDEADEAGMIVWAELPYVGAPSLSGGRGSDELWANAEQQLRELIRQNYNHPSIVMWSIGNEVDSAKAFGATKEEPSPVDLLRRMEEVAKEEDPYRPTVFADFSEDFGQFGERRQDLTGVADLVAYNRYPGWYYVPGAMAARGLAGMLDALHAKHPEIPIGVSEYGAGSGLTQFSDDPSSGYVAFAGRPQPEEYAAYVHEQLWPVIAERDYIYGSWVWNMFDFASDLRNEGDSVDINTKGLVSMDRELRKDPFYYYQAAWTEKPMIHLAGKRYVDRSYPVMDVKAYSNAPAARLTFNGRDLGQAECVNYTCVWEDVALQPGPNEARVTANVDGTILSDSATWDGIDAVAEGIRIDAGNLAASVVNGKRFGSDTFVTGGKPVARYAGSIGASGAGANVPVQAAQPELFDYWRSGQNFTYRVPVPDGNWTVTIHTLEPGKTNISPRAAEMLGSPANGFQPVVMSVSANGRMVIDGLNVAQAAGDTRQGIARSFPVRVSDGALELRFSSEEHAQAAVAAIEITR